MSKEKILEAYEQLALSYSKLIEHKPHNAYYDRPNTLSLIGDVTGKNILDAACGPGKYAEILMTDGATVTGVDLSPKMIECARKRNPNNGNFFVHDLSEPFDMFEDQSYDIILSALAMHYLEDWHPTIKEFHRLLKPGGSVVISIEHPFFEYNYFNSRQYFSVEPVKATWRGFGKKVEVHSYRRPLDYCISAFTENGFYIDRLLEPKPVAEFELLDPKHFQELNEFPAFLCIRAVKRD
ncbi:MAG: class I SAM-dependent methyltransferase [Bacteroidota bacterium]